MFKFWVEKLSGFSILEDICWIVKQMIWLIFWPFLKQILFLYIGKMKESGDWMHESFQSGFSLMQCKDLKVLGLFGMVLE